MKGDMKTVKKLWTGMAVLAILTPLGLIIPAWFHAGGAWGEWSLEEIRKLVGYVPEGMQKLSELWKSPMPDYTVPGQHQGTAHESLGYFLSAITGIAVTAGLTYLLAKF